MAASAQHKWLGLALVVCGFLAYSNCFQGEFIFDDSGGIVGNPYLTSLWPITRAMSAPRQTTNSGRPVACLSLALNYQISGMEVRGFRAGNLLIHLLAGLTLYGVLRRTLASGNGIPARLQAAAATAAFACALLWLLHPLQTMPVNYLIQRCESLMALFFLLTFYCAERSWEPGAAQNVWRICAIVSCALGMGSKEVMASAPVLVLLYERTFFAGTFRESLRRSWPLYAGLCGTWIILALLVLKGGTSEGANVGRLPFTGWEYLLTQARAIVYYLQLTVFPRSLCVDYGWNAARSLAEVWPQFLAVAGLGLAAVWAIVRHPIHGFLGACFFCILAPTSSFMPLPDVIVEYRMYLPLAAVVALLVCDAWILASGTTGAECAPQTSRIWLLACGVAALAFGVLTFQRNEDYHSAIQIWTDVTKKQPDNARGFANLGVALATHGQLALAGKALQRAEQLNPEHELVQMNLGAFLAMQGNTQQALIRFQRAVKLAPNQARNHYNLANSLSELGQAASAAAEYREAIRLDPDFVDARLNYGIDLFNAKDFATAELQFREALRVAPSHVDVLVMLGRTLVATGRLNDGTALFQRALSINPNSAQAKAELARLSARQ